MLPSNSGFYFVGKVGTFNCEKSGEPCRGTRKSCQEPAPTLLTGQVFLPHWRLGSSLRPKNYISSAFGHLFWGQTIIKIISYCWAKSFLQRFTPFFLEAKSCVLLMCFASIVIPELDSPTMAIGMGKTQRSFFGLGLGPQPVSTFLNIQMMSKPHSVTPLQLTIEIRPMAFDLLNF